MKKLIGTLLLSLCLAGGVKVSAVDIMNDKYAGAWEQNKPHSWGQCDAPYSGRNFPIWGESYCSASCGGHAIAFILLKAGLLTEGQTPVDIEDWLSSSGIAHYQGMYPFPSVEYKGKKMENVGEISSASGITDDHRKFIKDHYEKGHVMIVNVPYHFIAVDYVDSDGNIVVLDSGWKMKYLEGAWNAAHNYSGIVNTRIVAYKVEGVDASNIRNFWEGDAAASGDGSSSNSGDTGNGSYVNQGEIVSEPPEPIIQYEDDEKAKLDGGVKGVEKEGSVWDFIFGR